jgi:hypothetical protein
MVQIAPLKIAIGLLCVAVVCAQDASPSALLASPLPRKHTPSDLLDEGPCSGMEKGYSHLLTEPNQINQISWKVDVPDPSGTCMIRITNQHDLADYTTLFPTDGSADSKGAFPCGRQSVYLESKNVVFPEFDCDDCTLQWIWYTSAGPIY